MSLFGDRNGRPPLPRWVAAALFALIAVAGWQLTAWAVGAPYIVPEPLAVLTRIGQLAAEPGFWAAVASSLARILIGFACGMLAGGSLAVLMAAVPWIRQVFGPFVKVVRTVPVVCFILVALLWVRADVLPAVIPALMVLPVAWTHVIGGLDALDPAYVELARAFHLSPARRLFKVYLPAIGDQIAAAASVGLGLAWKSGVTAEVLALPLLGMGTQVYRAKIGLEAADIFSWTIVIVLLSLLLEQALKRILVRLGKRGST